MVFSQQQIWAAIHWDGIYIIITELIRTRRAKASVTAELNKGVQDRHVRQMIASKSSTTVCDIDEYTDSCEYGYAGSSRTNSNLIIIL